METPGMNEAITAVITAVIAAVIRYFEKRKMTREKDTNNHFRK
jgi:hypothetical protein